MSEEMSAEVMLAKAKKLAHVIAALNLFSHEINLKYRLWLFEYYQQGMYFKIEDYERWRKEYVEGATLRLGSDRKRCIEILRAAIERLEEDREGES